MSKAKSRIEAALTKFITFEMRIMTKPTKAYLKLKSYIAR